MALGGRSLSSPMHEVTYDFLVVPIKVSQKSLGDKPKSVYILLQTPTKCTQVNLILALRLELVIAYQVAGDYSFCASVTV